jgi:hypothetical protein
MDDGQTPVPPSGREEGPARRSEDVWGNVYDLNGRRVEGQAREEGPIALAHIFVSRLGRIGYWLPACSFCGHEHIHGPYPPFDPRERRGYSKHQTNLTGPNSLGWRGSHCCQSPHNFWCSIREGEYELVLAPGPARFAPGAAGSRRAKDAMQFLQSLGIETSNETIPSELPPSWWRWR